MGTELKTILRKNELAISESQLNRIESGLDKGGLSFLSPAREWPIFLLYSFGRTIEEISSETGLPSDVIVLTALHYDWPSKINQIKASQDISKVNEVQKDLVNTILLATYASLKKELAEVIAGHKNSADVKMIPKDITELEKLLKSIASVHGMTLPSDKALKGGGTAVHATNVQIINNNPSTESPIEKTKAERLKELREKRGQGT